MTERPEGQALWDVADVARFLSCSVSFVYKAAARGELPCVRVGAMLRFCPHAIRALARGGGPPSSHAPRDGRGEEG